MSDQISWTHIAPFLTKRDLYRHPAIRKAQFCADGCARKKRAYQIYQDLQVLALWEP